MNSDMMDSLVEQHIGYRVTFGRSDKSAVKGITHISRNRALKLANYLGFILFYIHPFKNSETRGYAKYEANGFFVEFKEVEMEDVEQNPARIPESATLAA